MPEDLQEEIFRLKEENKILRKYLWLNHGCESHCLYGDDGEMQCNCCLIDFKRDSINQIVDRINYKKMKAIYGDKVTKAFFRIMSEQSK